MNTYGATDVEKELVQRVASCIYVTAGDTHPERAERAARELVRRGWIAVNRVDLNTRESSGGPVSS